MDRCINTGILQERDEQLVHEFITASKRDPIGADQIMLSKDQSSQSKRDNRSLTFGQ